MKTKQIIQITGRIIIMMLALYSVHTMLACGGSGDTLTYDDPGSGNDGGGDNPPTDSANMSLSGTVGGQSVDVALEDGDVRVSICDFTNHNNIYDAEDEGIEFVFTAIPLEQNVTLSGYVILTTFYNLSDDASYTYSADSFSNLGYVTLNTGSDSSIYTIQNGILQIESIDLSPETANLAGTLTLTLANSLGSLVIEVSENIVFDHMGGI